MRGLRGVAGLGLVVLLALGGALPAYGGGPTSVLVVSPVNEKAAALYATQTEYAQLQSYVDEAGRRSEVFKPDQRSPHESGDTVRLTWLIHDTSVWRTDWIYPAADGGPWIASRLVDQRGDVWEQPVRWHTSADPKGLLALLGKLGVMTRGGSADGGYVIQTPPVPQPQAQSQVEPQPAAAQDEPVLSGWRWLIPGFVAGAAVMLLAVQLIPIWQRRDRTPRMELIE
jgi:hypothetical protein